MTHPGPPGYHGPDSPARDPAQVLSDPVAQNCIARLVDLHEALCQRGTQQIAMAAMGTANPDNGYLTGSGEHDRMDAAAAAVRQEERDARQLIRNAHQELRRTAEWYERQLGMRPPRRPHVESIDYRNGDGQRKVG